MPRKGGQQVAPADEVQPASAEEFPSLAEVKQQQQRQRQGRPAISKQKEHEQKSKQADAVEEQHQPRLLNWPGWQQPAGAPTAGGGTVHQRAPLVAVPGAAGRGKHHKQQQKGSKQRGRQQQQQQQQQQPQQEQQSGNAIAGTEQTSLLLGVEYESVQGQRLLLTPALLAAAVQSSLDPVAVRQHAQQAAPAAPGPKTAAAAAAAAATPPASVAAFLLLQDLPLWLQLPGEQLAQLGGGGSGGKQRRSSTAAAPASGDRPSSLIWLQLRRLFVGAPEVAVPLEADPRLLLEVPRDMLAPAAAPEGASSGSGTSGGTSGAATVQLQYGLAAPLSIPAGSFCVLALPWLLTAPMNPSGTAAEGGGGSGGPAALIRQSGPLRAVLLGRTALHPVAASAMQS